MTKFQIIGEGTAFHDDWNVNSNDVAAVRINGRCVERMGKDGGGSGRLNWCGGVLKASEHYC